MKLDGRICVITGGASGIGLEIAKCFAAAGGKVAIADIDLDAAKTAAASLGDGHMGAYRAARKHTDRIALIEGGPCGRVVHACLA